MRRPGAQDPGGLALPARMSSSVENNSFNLSLHRKYRGGQSGKGEMHLSGPAGRRPSRLDRPALLPFPRRPLRSHAMPRCRARGLLAALALLATAPAPAAAPKAPARPSFVVLLADDL